MLDGLVRQQNRAYNLAIASFAEADQRPVLRNDDLSKANLRPLIRDYVRDEVAARGEAFVSSWVDEAINSAFVTRDAVIRNRRAGSRCGFNFKSRKAPIQSFLVQRLARGFFEKTFRAAEQLPAEAFGKLTRIMAQNGRWYIAAQKQIETAEAREIQAGSIVAIDPGVRCFATAYSRHDVAKYGDGFYRARVYPLLLKLDRIIGLRARTKDPEWKRHYGKKIDRIRARISDRIDDLHRRTAYDLVTRHDIIFLPTFETSRMAAKEDRNIRTKTVRMMLGLGHYRFQSMLKWMCKKYGKSLIICDEAYTTKTRSWDGVMVPGVGGASTISDGKIRVDRDINGARGILLRAIYGLGRSPDSADVAFVAV